MKTIRWGIAGPGIIANKFAKAIGNVEGAALCAVASRSKERGEAFAEMYSIPEVFASYEEMAASDKVDAVYISTAHPFHKPCAEIFLRAKKHVLCEKPMCVNKREAESLCALAKENGVFLMEAMWTRFIPAVIELEKIVKNGEIGEVFDISADFCYASSPEEEVKLFQNEMAGGSLLDVGVYGLHFVSLFMGAEPEEIKAVARIENGVDLHTKIHLRFGEGKTASVSSAISLKKPEDAYIYGTKGYIHIPAFYGANSFTVYKDGVAKQYEKPSLGDGFEEEIIETCRCIREGRMESERFPHHETLRILSLMDEIRKQIRVSYKADSM